MLKIVVLNLAQVYGKDGFATGYASLRWLVYSDIILGKFHGCSSVTSTPIDPPDISHK